MHSLGLENDDAYFIGSARGSLSKKILHQCFFTKARSSGLSEFIIQEPTKLDFGVRDPYPRSETVPRKFECDDDDEFLEFSNWFDPDIEVTLEIEQKGDINYFTYNTVSAHVYM